MLGFRKIRQLEESIPLTGYMVPMANPDDFEEHETFHSKIGDMLLLTDIAYDGTTMIFNERTPAYRFDKEEGALYLKDKGIGTAKMASIPIDIRLDIADVIAQTNDANCVITCPEHGFLTDDEVEIFNVDATVNNKWEIDVIDTDSFYLKKTAGKGPHGQIYQGGGIAWKRGGLRLDIYQDERDLPEEQTVNFGQNMAATKEIYYNDEPVFTLYLNGTNVWGRKEGINEPSFTYIISDN